MPHFTKRAIAIAHYDQAGAVRSDLLALVEHLAVIAEKLVFVSTNLNQESARKLEPFCTVITRPNTGYDFLSYKVGLEALGVLKDYDEVVILNSSFLTLDPEKLVKRFLDFPRTPNRLLGITRSNEFSEHLQSYFVAFPQEVVRSSYFSDWWKSVVPIDKREEVIQRYELGMSSFFLDHGCGIDTLFNPTPEQEAKALKRFRQIYGAIADTSSASNPTHFNWDDLLEEVGIIKVELVARNPHGMALASFYRRYGKSHREVRSGRTYRDRAKQLRRSLRRIVGV